MVFFNYSIMQMVVKIVYYGFGFCGKMINLQYIYGYMSQDFCGEMVLFEIEIDCMFFFDLFFIDVGSIQGFNIWIQFYMVFGQVFYNMICKFVFKGVDGVVFVVDFQCVMLQVNIEFFSNFEENLVEIGLLML